MYAHNMQNEENDCGIAVILTVLDCLKINHEDFGDNYNQTKDIRQQGLTFKNINDIFKLYGINSDGYIVDDFQELKKQKFPIIAMIQQDGLPHYVVIHEIKDQDVIISNPSESKIKKISTPEFLKSFSHKVICIESVNKINSKAKTTDKMYDRVIKKISTKDKMQIISLTLCQMLIPIVSVLVIEYLISQKLGDLTSNKVLSVLFIYVPALLFFRYSSMKSAEIRIKITNRLQKDVMERYYISELEDPSFNKNISNISGYFWNLMSAIGGIIQQFYLKIDILYGTMLFVVLVFLSPYSIPIIAFWVLIFFLIAKRNDDVVSNLYSETLKKSNVLASVFQDNVKTANDITSFNKKEEAFSFFHQKMESLFSSNVALVEIDTKMNTLLQVVTICITLSYFILFFAFSKIGSLRSLESLGNGLLFLYLVTSNLQHIYSSWMSSHKSKNAVSYIENQRRFFRSLTPKVHLPFDKVESIEINNLHFSYGNNKLFNGTRLKFERGNICGITGDNGSGKSTLINLILGFLKEQQMDVIINDRKISSLYDSDIINHVSYYSTEMSTYNGTVKNNVNFSIFGDNDNDSYKNQLNLNLSDDYVVTGEGNNISVGQKQKVLLMRTLNRNREIYIFDEPTGNLDTKSTDQFLREISVLRDRNKIVILVTHQKSLLNHCDVIYELIGGSIHEKK